MINYGDNVNEIVIAFFTVAHFSNRSKLSCVLDFIKEERAREKDFFLVDKFMVAQGQSESSLLRRHCLYEAQI
jgi:hypothetical protein